MYNLTLFRILPLKFCEAYSTFYVAQKHIYRKYNIGKLTAMHQVSIRLEISGC